MPRRYYGGSKDEDIDEWIKDGGYILRRCKWCGRTTFMAKATIKRKGYEHFKTEKEQKAHECHCPYNPINPNFRGYSNYYLRNETIELKKQREKREKEFEELETFEQKSENYEGMILSENVLRVQELMKRFPDVWKRLTDRDKIDILEGREQMTMKEFM